MNSASALGRATTFCFLILQITGDYYSELEQSKRYLTEEFEFKDLGSLKYFFLGMEVARSRTGIVVSQRKYILDLLEETRMLGCKPNETPMEPNVKLELKVAKT